MTMATKGPVGEAETSHLLEGLRAHDPLAFLAALGALRTMDRSGEADTPKMHWSREESNWCPWLSLRTEISEDQIIALLAEELDDDTDAIRYTMSPGDGTNDRLRDVEAEEFRSITETVEPGTRNEEAVASYGSDAFADHPEIAELWPREEGSAMTRLNLVEYAGPLAFLGAQRKLVMETTKEKLRAALFEPWRYSDDASGKRTMRWSPTDGARARGAYTGIDPTNLENKTVHGANRLAIEGSRLFPVVPESSRNVVTAGFVREEDEDDVTAFQYPVWRTPITVQTARTLITHPEIATADPTPDRIPEVENILRAQVEIYNTYRNLGRAIPIA